MFNKISIYTHIYIHIYIVYVWCISNVATFFKASVCVFYKSNKNRKLQYPRIKFSKLKISPTHDWLVKFLPSSPPWAFHTGPFATHPWISWCLGCMWALALTLGPLHFHRVTPAFEMGIHIYRIIWAITWVDDVNGPLLGVSKAEFSSLYRGSFCQITWFSGRSSLTQIK